MKRLNQLWEKLRGSFWFIPTILVLVSGTLALVLVELDREAGMDWAERFPRIFATGAEGARGILESIATSMITVAGVTFSITILILSQASMQYSPRILRNFVRDRSNQLVLGAFVAIFVYCLLVLRAIRQVEQAQFVPHFSTFVGIGMALVGIGVLIFFIHHIAYSIQATTILGRAASETLEQVDTLYPEELGSGMYDLPEELPSELGDEEQWHRVEAAESGYLAYAASDALLAFAEEHDTIVRLDVQIGEFVVQGAPIAFLSRPPGDEEKAQLLKTFSISPYRTVEQDVSFGIRQLVDIALRALSPSLNDTTTANMCVDRLTSILARLIQRKMESPFRSKDGQLRVIARRPAFHELLADCFEQIRQNAGGNVRVLHQLVHVVRVVMDLTRNRSRLQALKFQLELVREVVERTVPSAADRGRILGDCDHVLLMLSELDEELKTSHDGSPEDHGK